MDLDLLRKNMAVSTTLAPRFDVRNFLVRRVARPGDDLQIAALLEQSFVSVYEKKLQLTTPEGRRRELRDVATRRENGMVGVLELGYRIVGTFSLIAPLAKSSQCWIPEAANLRCLAVDPEFQGYGFSDLLVRWADEVGRAWKVSTMCLHIQEGADSLGKLYSRHGYERAPEGDTSSHQGPILGYKKFMEPLA